MKVKYSDKYRGNKIKRYSEILSILARYGFEEVFSRGNAIKRFFRRLFGKKNINPVITGRWERVRHMLEELGPTYVKFGQVMSNRPDILPNELIDELSKLQESVKPFDGAIAKDIVERELGNSINQLYSEFDTTPFASASIAQVHRAKLISGEDVVVKIMRPGIKSLIKVDLSIMYTLAKVAEQQFRRLRFFTPTEVVHEFEKAIKKETDFNIELAHIERFRQQFKDNNDVLIPETYKSYCTNKVLTMEYIDGISPTELEQLQKANIDIADAANKLVNNMMMQVFKYAYFHADPHPGNLRILSDGRICFLDYGLMGSLIPEWKKQLTTLLISLSKRDSGRIADAILVLARNTDLDIKISLEYEINEMLDKYSFVSLKAINLGTLLQEVLHIIYNFKLRFPPAFYLIGKTISLVESIALRLHPEFNVIDSLQPFAKSMIKDRFNPKSMSREIGYTLAEASLMLKELPGEMRDIVQQLRSGNTQIQFQHRGLGELTNRLERSGNRLSYAIVLAALIIGSSFMTVSKIPPLWKDIPLIGLTGFLISGLMGFALLFSTFRRIRK